MKRYEVVIEVSQTEMLVCVVNKNKEIPLYDNVKQLTSVSHRITDVCFSFGNPVNFCDVVTTSGAWIDLLEFEIKRMCYANTSKER